MISIFYKKTRPRNASPRVLCGEGFTLLEMAIVVAIIAVILAGGAVTFSASVQQKQFDQTKEKMALLQKALRDYWLTFGRLPCPANLSLYNNVDTAATHGNFGLEAETPGACTGGTPAANFDETLGGGNIIVAGMIPTKTLRLPDEMAFDGWGRRIFYAVDADYTATTAATDIPNADSDVVSGITRITVRSANSDPKTTQAVYVLLSHGPNGHGAYGRYNSSTRISSGSANTLELENCDCTDAAANGIFNATFHQSFYSTDTGSVTDTFDDLLLFTTRANLASSKE